PDRLKKSDVPKISRDVPADVLTQAIASASSEAELRTVEFLLENMSKRMAGGLREDAAGMSVKGKRGEAAQNAVISTIRDLVQAGEVDLKDPDSDEEE
ncbi:MAG TPA: flagellar motor switch protein FliG, partial [Citreicella sp.]|nr:flagellar motor switch protein FliG [Citreicella sp.]